MLTRFIYNPARVYATRGLRSSLRPHLFTKSRSILKPSTALTVSSGGSSTCGLSQPCAQFMRRNLYSPARRAPAKVSELPFQMKKVTEWTTEEVKQWAETLRIVATNKLQLLDGVTGQSLAKLDEMPLINKGFGKSEAQVILREIIREMVAANDLTEEVVIRATGTTLQKMVAVLNKSKDLAYQKQAISPRIKKCLPLATDKDVWDPAFFTDIRDSEFYKELIDVIQSSAPSDQNASLIHLVQMSGCGKSHIARQYVMENGGIYISFKKVHHDHFLEEAYRCILEEIRERQYMAAQEVGAFEEEDEFTQFSLRAITLIPLTFIEFAKYFEDQVAEQYPNLTSSEKREAFVRATLNGGQSLIFALYKRNLALYLKDKPRFTHFRDTLVSYAYANNYRCIVYDEVHSLANILQGQFLHSYPTEASQSRMSSSVGPTTDQQQLLLDRLAYERKGNVVPRFAQDFKRQTSLLYLLVLAMEDFAKSQLPQVTASTSYSSTVFSDEGQRYSRDRLPVKQLIVPQLTGALARFMKIINTAFGSAVVKHFQRHEDTLKKLESRPVYLFSILQQPPPVKKNLREFVDAFVIGAESRALALAGQYLQQSLNRLDLKPLMYNTIMRVSLGGLPVEVEDREVESLVSAGILSFPNSWTKGPLAVEHVDPYLRSVMHKFDLSTLIKSMPNIVQVAKPTNIGEMGEYVCNLHLKLLGQATRNISLLSFVHQLHLDSTVARKFTLAESLHVVKCLNANDTAIELFANPQQNSNLIIRPTSAMGPDSIVPMLDLDSIRSYPTVGGFLLLQSKHHNSSLNEKNMPTALASVDPAKFLRGATNQKKEFLKVMNTLPTSFAWVRVIYARAFTKQVWTDVGKYNQTTTGKLFPVILMTARSLPEILQRTELFSPINSQGTPDWDNPSSTDEVLETPEYQAASIITPKEALRLKGIYGLDLSTLLQPSPSK